VAASFLLRETSELLGKLQAAPPPLSAPVHASDHRLCRIVERVEQNLEQRRLALLGQVLELRSGAAANCDAKQALNGLRKRFDEYLSRRDGYADALQQRVVPELGGWLAGMDALALDALPSPHALLTSVDRGARARITQLYGLDGSLEASLVVIPRERLPSPFLAASLLHEVGHAVAAELDLVPALRRGLESAPLRHRKIFAGWLSEITPDLWALLHLGPLSTAALMHVVSYPHEDVWKLDLDDPHPTPWLRALLSAQLGHAIWPNPWFARLAREWTHTFPLATAAGASKRTVSELQLELPQLARRLVAQPIPRWRGLTMRQFVADRQRGFWRVDANSSTPLRAMAPTLAVATLGQRWLGGREGSAVPHDIMRSLLRTWGGRNWTGAMPAKKEWSHHDLQRISA
jgi:hypothetical protein